MSTILIVGLLYLVITLLIGFYAMKLTKTSADFFIAGKRLGIFFMAMGAYSAGISGTLFVGGPGLIYSVGLGALWLTIPSTASFAMCFYLLGKRMRLLAEQGAMTTADAIYARYESKVASGLAGLATLVGLVLYMATQILALGVCLAFVFNISLTWGVIIGMGVIMVYSIAGGIIAGVYTDVFQGTVMVVSALVVFILTLIVGGGMGHITSTFATANFTGMKTALPQFAGQWGLAPATLAMSWFFALGIGAVGQPHVVTKFYMLKEVSKLKWGPLLTATPAFITGLLMMGVGLVTRYLVVMGQAAPLKNPDDAISFFLINYTPPLVAGIVMAGIAAAIMSTCDSFINIASAAAVRDIPFAFGRKLDDHKQLVYGRYAILIISVITVLVALNLNTLGVALLGVFGWSTFAAALGPALALGLNWKRATREAAVASISVGLFLNIILEGLKVLKIYALPHGIYNGAFTMLVSLAIFIIVSYLTAPTKIRPEMERVLDA